MWLDAFPNRVPLGSAQVLSGATRYAIVPDQLPYFGHHRWHGTGLEFRADFAGKAERAQMPQKTKPGHIGASSNQAAFS